MAKTNPKMLVNVLKDTATDNITLTYGVEILGNEIKDEDLVLPVLKKLLNHQNVVVREGACIGISAFYVDKVPPDDILNKLKTMSKSDPSPIIKEIAEYTLQDFS
jgi:hypothetical protein